jgi:DNA-binding beta-propeller fold protein YncE
MRTRTPHLASTHALAALLATIAVGAAASPAAAATGFGRISGAGGCLVAPGHGETSTTGCGEGKGLVGANSVAVSPDGLNVYVASGVVGTNVAASYGSLAILKRNPETGALTQVGCLSSDGTDGRDGASGACTPTPTLLGADGVAVSPDGSTVFVTSASSGSIVAFSRDPSTGSLTRLGCFQFSSFDGSPCRVARIFASAGPIVVGPENKSLYVAQSLFGAISTFLAPTAASEPTGPTGATGATGPSGPEPTVASLFSGTLLSQLLGNECVAVNGADGPCSVGTSMQGVEGLVLSPDGHNLYAAAPGSKAIDVFGRGSSGALTEIGCLMVSAPPGICVSGKGMMHEPTQLAVSPDGHNLYASDSESSGDSVGGNGQVDILSRTATGAIAESSCMNFLPEPVEENKEEAGEEGEKEGGEGGREEEHEEHQPETHGPCTGVPGMMGKTHVVAVSHDGSAVYAVNSESAVLFARDSSTGKLTETGCSASEDKRCSSFPSLGEKLGAAVSPDGRDLYVASPHNNAVYGFAIGATVTIGHTSATRAGRATVAVACPRAARRPCSGHLDLEHAAREHSRRGSRNAHGAGARGGSSTAAHLALAKRVHRLRAAVRRVKVGDSQHFKIRPGHMRLISVRLTRPWQQLLDRSKLLRVLTVVRADPRGGGSGTGRQLTLTLQRR